MLKKLFVMVSLTVSMYGSASAVMAAGNEDAGKAKSAVCAACHGAQGISSMPVNPNLAGQVPGYIKTQLQAFKSGDRVNAVMAGQVVNLSEQDMADLDAYYVSLPASTGIGLSAEDKTLAEAGESIYRGGFADEGIAPCQGCHGPSAHGIPTRYPRVSAQHKQYLEQQLLAFKRGERKGYNDIMWNIAFGLSELQIKQLSAYMAGLK